MAEPSEPSAAPAVGSPTTLPGAFRTRNYYDLDKAGNWTQTETGLVLPAGDVAEQTQTRENNILNQVVSTKEGEEKTALSYDPNGNLLADGRHEYRYDVFDRLREVWRDGKLVASYYYDALGRRVRKVVPVDQAAASGEEGSAELSVAQTKPEATKSTVQFRYDSLDRPVEETQEIEGSASARSVATTRFWSTEPEETRYPNGRRVRCRYDALYRKDRVTDMDPPAGEVGVCDTLYETGLPIAEWWFMGPGRVAAKRLGNDVLCSHMNDAMTRSAVQSEAELAAQWGEACSDRLGYDGAGRLIACRYLAPSPQPLDIQIVNSEELEAFPNHYRYDWRRVVYLGGGRFGFFEPEINQDTDCHGPGFNTFEANNAERGLQGSGDELPAPPPEVKMLPIGIGAVVLDAKVRLNCEGFLEVYFTAPNNPGGSCG